MTGQKLFVTGSRRNLVALLFIALAGCFLTAPILAQSLSGTELEIGTGGSPTNGQVSPNGRSGAVGVDNTVGGWGASDSFAVGVSNGISYSARIAAFGSDLYGYYSWCSTLFGRYHSAYFANSTAILGYANSAWDADNGWLMPESVMLTGSYNRSANEVRGGFSSGRNNELYALYDSENGVYAALLSACAIGEGLINQWSHSTVLGQWNDSSISLTDGLIFAIGNGTDATTRSNAFEVYTDGSIRMARQGDVLMGPYGY